MGQIIKKTFVVFLSLLVLMKDVYALGHEGARDSNFSASEPSFCDTGSLSNFDPLGTSGSRDVRWVITNPVCYGFIIGLGVSILAAAEGASAMCVANAGLAVVPTSPYATIPTNSAMRSSPVLGFSTAVKYAAVLSDCASRSGLSGSAGAAATLACAGPQAGSPACVNATAWAAAAVTDQTSCCLAFSTYTAAVSAGVAYLASLYAVARDTYNKARVCGHDWYSWKEFDVNGTAQTGGGYWRRGTYEHSYSKKLDDVFLRGMTHAGIDSTRQFTNKNYREFFYGGREFIDSDGPCSSPSNWTEDQHMARLGYPKNTSVSVFQPNPETPQRYYMRGPGVVSHYACHRFLTSGTNRPGPEERAAYDCCVARSQGTMCIENETDLARRFGHGGYDSKFCRIGEDCMSSGVGFTIEESQSQISTICAQTKTLCPYDHLLGGGTEYRDRAEVRSGDTISPRIRNYCQFNKHCVKVPARPYVRINDFTSAFISTACMNFVGHSQNTYSNTNELLPVSNIKNFSAPLAECMAQTIKNMIQNRAGFTRCSNPDESPQRVGSQYICESGYDFREGDRLLTPGPFEKFQTLLRTMIKVVLALSITFLGYSVLLALKPIERKTILIFVLKFAFVVYFALGDGWQKLFVDSIFNISSELAGIVMKIDDESLIRNPASQNRLDGCQFPKFNAALTRDATTYTDPATDPFYAVANPGQRQYTPGYEYLKPWDTLDCKFVRALGFGPEMSVPNLILTILAGLLTGGLGIIFVIFTFIFAFLYVAMIIRALHIFLVSTIAIAILILVSPLTITAILFQKTKNIFDGWLKQLLGFIIQPVILFAYLAIFIAVMDYSIYGIRHDLPDNGGITFSGDGLDTPKGTICSGDAHNKSLFCIFGFATFGTYSGLEPIGILAPFVVNLNKEKLNTIIQAGLLMFIFSKFMDKISDMAQNLTGSSAISSGTPSAARIAAKAGGIARGIQKRGTRVAKRAIIGSAKKTGRAIAAVTTKKASVDDKDSASASEGAGKDTSGSSGGDAAAPTSPPDGGGGDGGAPKDDK